METLYYHFLNVRLSISVRVEFIKRDGTTAAGY